MIRPELPSETYAARSLAYAIPRNTLRHAPSSSASPARSPWLGREATRCLVRIGPCFWRPSTVRENRSGPLFTDTIVRPEGLIARPNGPGPVEYCRPEGAMMRPPGRMLGAPGRRIAGREPAGAE